MTQTLLICMYAHHINFGVVNACYFKREDVDSVPAHYWFTRQKPAMTISKLLKNIPASLFNPTSDSFDLGKLEFAFQIFLRILHHVQGFLTSV